MKRNLKDNLKLTSYEELFSSTQEDLTVSSETQVVEIPIEELHEFKNHPFKVLDDEKMDETIASVREKGILEPIKVRRRPEGGYEIISGHRRKYACEKVGIDKIPAFVHDYSDDEATIIMVDSNIYREKLLISEKARAYAMKYYAEKHQGKDCGDLLDDMAEETGENRKKLQRYLRLSKLVPQLLDLVDEKKLGLVPGIDLSFLTEEHQLWVYEVIKQDEIDITTQQSAILKKISKDTPELFTREMVLEVLAHKKASTRKFSMSEKKLAQYFDPRYSAEDIENIIIDLLERWKQGEQ